MNFNDILEYFPFPEFRDRQASVLSRVGVALSEDKDVLAQV